MILTTTYQQLLYQGIDNEYLTALGQVTGDKDVYGLNTPISIRLIADTVGLDIAMYCLEAVEDDIIALCANMSADAIERYLYIWRETFPSDSRVEDLVYQTLQYVNTFVAPDEARVDYCGNPLGSPSDFQLSNLEGLITNLSEFLANQNQTGSPQQFYRSVLTADLPLNIRNRIYTVVDGPALDWMLSQYVPPFGQEQFPIEDIFNGVRGKSFLVQSEEFEQAAKNQPLENDPFAVYTGIAYQIWDAATPLQNEVLMGAVTLGYAAIALARNVINSSKGIWNVYGLIQSAYATYNSGKLKTLDNEIGRLNTMMNAGAPPIRALVGSGDDIDSTVYNAAIEERVRLLRDLNYIKSFDSTNTGFLSTAQRRIMELDLRYRMVTARKNRANELLNTKQNEITAYINSEAELQPIFNLYVT